MEVVDPFEGSVRCSPGGVDGYSGLGKTEGDKTSPPEYGYRSLRVLH